MVSLGQDDSQVPLASLAWRRIPVHERTAEICMSRARMLCSTWLRVLLLAGFALQPVRVRCLILMLSQGC